VTAKLCKVAIRGDRCGEFSVGFPTTRLPEPLDHGPPEQGRGQRVLSFDQLRRRIQQVVEISVDLRGTGQYQPGGAGLVGPTSEKVERRRETPEVKGMSMARSSASTSSNSGSFFR
jgi:hypothetical protein